MRPALTCLTLCAVAVVAPLAAQTNAPAPAAARQDAKRMLKARDYGKWESLTAGTLSRDGRWLAYGIRRQNGESELCLHMLAADSKQDFENGSGPVFSPDSKWLAFRIGVTEKTREKLTKAKKPVRNELGLHDLVTGKTTKIENVASFRFSDDGNWLVMRRYPIKGRKSSGVDTIVRDLASSRDTNFGNVGSYAWCDDGSKLAMTIDAEDKAGNGIQVYDAATGVLRTLDSAAQKYGSLTWRKDAADLAVLRGRDRDEKKDEDASFVVLTWRGLDAKKPRAKTFDHLAEPNFPKDMRVVDHAGLRWSKDGEAVFFGIKAWENKPKGKDQGKAKQGTKPDLAKRGDDPVKPVADAAAKRSKSEKKTPKSLRESIDEAAGVEIWHAKDIDILPRQKKTASMDRRKNFLAGWWLQSNQFVQLGNDLTERVVLARHEKHAFGLDNTPYEPQKRFGPTLWNVYVIDTTTGSGTKILTGLKYQSGASPDGRYLLYVRAGQLWTYDIQQNKHRDLTGDLKAKFVNQEISSLTDEKPPYGIAGWTEDGAYLFAYDRYDVWMIRADGSGSKRLTHGAGTRTRYRRVVLDREEDEFIDLEKPIYLSCYGDLTKKSGYARMTIGDAPQPLILADKRISRLVKAKDADVYAFVEEAFDDSPDFFVADADLADRRQISKTNPFQKDFFWGRGELVDYVNDHGQKLQGALHYPAGYVEGKQYPMIVYIYELRSQNLHRYSTPSERQPYNPAVFTSQGYFVFQPDIVYRPQNPGLSAVECVVPAVKKVLESGRIDPARVGLVGHSWGAYQTAFIVTQTDLFAAGVAGAPLTNMMSMSMSIYWNSGQSDAWIFHESQGRMDRPFWKDVDTYIKNSPIFSIDNLNTPLLVAFGDKDGAVDWHQGVEMYNAARLAQKPLVLLVYAGENHGLRKKPNQVDYHHRVLEWFDTHLNGAKAPQWITRGKTHLQREKELKAHKRKQGKAGDKAKATKPRSLR